MMKKVLLTAGLLSGVAMQAGATGYEQTIEWSGRYGSEAGIGLNGSGAEALYFNPAGLAKGTTGSEISLNLSPQSGQAKGPYTVDGESLTSKSNTAVTGGLLYNYNITPDLGVGIGAYVGAGVSAEFDNIAFSGFTSTPKLQNTVVDEEIAIGAGYQIIPGLKVGAAIREAFIKATVAGASVAALPAQIGGGNLLTSLDTENISGRQWGYNIGAQFSPSKDWGVSLDYRSRLKITAHGTTTGAYEIAGNGGGLNGKGTLTTSSSSDVSSSLPELWALGGFYHISDTWHLMAELDLAKYSQNQTITMSGNFTYPAPLNMTKDNPTVAQYMNDQYTLRVAAAYSGFDWPIRFGVIYQTIAENSDYSNPATFPPGHNMTFTLGTGHRIMDGMTIDGGVAYSTDSASVSDPTGAAAAASATKAGTYTATDIALHLGLTYLF